MMVSFFLTRVMFFAVIAVMYVSLLFSNETRTGSLFLLANFVTVVLSTVALIARGAPSYSSYRCIFMFSLIIFGITPLFEFQRGLTYQYHDLRIFEDYAETSVLVLVGMLTFFLGYQLKPKNERRNHYFRIRNPILMVAFSAAAGLIILAYNSFSVISLFVRGGELDQTVGGSSLDIMFLVVVFPIPMCCLILYLRFSERRDPLILSLLLLLAAFFNFPTGMPRFLSATLYLTALYAYNPNIFKSRIALPTVFLFGIFFVFPLLGAFRNLNSLDDVQLFFGYEIIVAGAFDAFQNFVLSVEHLEITYGYQMIGALLFFVPRSIWPAKPVDTGSLLAIETGLPHQNIALNYLGEGYVNFGILGVLVFGIALGIFSSQLDARLERGTFRSPVWALFAAIFPALSFFLMRGGLLSAVAYCSGLFVCLFLLSALFTRRVRIRN